MGVHFCRYNLAMNHSFDLVVIRLNFFNKCVTYINIFVAKEKTMISFPELNFHYRLVNQQLEIDFLQNN